jgi:RNA polymerase sigma-54 factor
MAEHFLSQTQSQQQTQMLAPQLRQGLEMLQLPILELRAMVAQELQVNPTLEESPGDSITVEVEEGLNREAEDRARDADLDDFSRKFEELARLDDEWREHFHAAGVVHGRPTEEEEARRQHLLDSATSGATSLQGHLLEQLSYSGLDGMDRQLAEMIVGSIDDSGYLATSLEELAITGGFDVPRLERALETVQGFDPPGVGARNLKECLLLQLRRQGRGAGIEARVVEFHLHDLGSHKYAVIARAMKLDDAEVERIAREIANLDPKPGRAFLSEPPAYVLPEVFIERHEDQFVVRTNDEELPRLRISEHYKTLMADEGTTDEVKGYIRDKVRAGTFLIRNIDQRQQTIRNIAREVLAVQREFMEEGVSKLRPLTMAEVADKLGLHETTISRAIANKYISTPQGVFELKYFFTPGYRGADGQVVSNKTVKDIIQQLIAGESPRRPLSDQVIVGILKEKGFEVARRTVAKYREEMNILPSHMRKGS